MNKIKEWCANNKREVRIGGIVIAVIVIAISVAYLRWNYLHEPLYEENGFNRLGYLELSTDADFHLPIASFEFEMNRYSNKDPELILTEKADYKFNDVEVVVYLKPYGSKGSYILYPRLSIKFDEDGDIESYNFLMSDDDKMKLFEEIRKGTAARKAEHDFHVYNGYCVGCELTQISGTLEED